MDDNVDVAGGVLGVSSCSSHGSSYVFAHDMCGSMGARRAGDVMSRRMGGKMTRRVGGRESSCGGVASGDRSVSEMTPTLLSAGDTLDSDDGDVVADGVRTALLSP